MNENLDNHARGGETHMADPPRYPDTDDDTGVGPDRESTTGTPRWVKVFGIIALVVVLLFVILLFTRGPGGGHGPSRHTLDQSQEQVIDTDDGGGQAPPERGH